MIDATNKEKLFYATFAAILVGHYMLPLILQKLEYDNYHLSDVMFKNFHL